MLRNVLRHLLGPEAEDCPSLTPKELLILETLGPGEKFGLQIVAESGGSVGRGTVYVTLSRMEEKGLVESRQEAVSTESRVLPRRLYRITGEGQRAQRAYASMAAALGEAVRS